MRTHPARASGRMSVASSCFLHSPGRVHLQGLPLSAASMYLGPAVPHILEGKTGHAQTINAQACMGESIPQANEVEK